MKLTKKLFLLLCLTYVTAINAQDNDIFHLLKHKESKYEQIIEKAEAHFKKKHPRKSAKQLTQGPYRDGAYVKYQRWKSYWENYQTPDGTLKSISDFYIQEAASQKRKRQSNSRSKNDNPYLSTQWTNISNDLDLGVQIGLGRTTCIGFHPSNPDLFYVGSAYGGIWKTTDGGRTYKPLGDRLPQLSVNSIAVDADNPSTIYIALCDQYGYPPSIGIYVSRDGGITWSPTAYRTSFSEDEIIYEILPHPNNPQVLFAATSNGLYRTEDGFASYYQLNDLGTYDLAFHPTNANIVYQIGYNGNFRKSTDGGNSFSTVKMFDVNSANHQIATSPQAPNTIYLLIGNQLYKSTNSGNSFRQQNSGVDEGILLVAPNDANKILAGYFDAYISRDGGSSFNRISDWLGRDGLPLIHVDQRNAFNHPLRPNEVLINNDGGVYRYNWNNGLFENLSNGLIITQYYDIAVSQTEPMIISGGSQDNGSMFRKTDGKWQEYAGTGDGMVTEIDPTNANIRYWSYQNGALQRWSNGSNTEISPPGEGGNGYWETPFKLDPSNPNRLVAGYQSVYASTNRGNSWQAISEDLNSGQLITQIVIAPSNGERIYAVQGDDLFVKATNTNTWTKKPAPVGGKITDIEVDPNNMNIVYITYAGFSEGQKVYNSRDAGTTWQNISGSLPNVPVGAIETYREVPDALFVGTDAGVFYRDYQMKDWLEYGDFVHTNITDLEIQYSTQKLRAGTYGRGVFEAAISTVTCDERSPDADDDGICDLFDVCPNQNDNIIGTPCEDGNPITSGETYTSNCECAGGYINANYCQAEGSSGTGADWIASVNLNTIQNASEQSAYSDFTNQVTDLNRGDEYTLSVGLNAAFDLDEVYAWIDYNQDGVFENATERIDLPSITNNKSTYTFTVPKEASVGLTVMRVRVIYASPNTPQACGSFFGEVEDYGIHIKKPLSKIYTKVFLEGFYNGVDGLTKYPDHTALLPTTQPFNTTPWNYQGTETISTIPSEVIDWVLLVTRDVAGTIQEQKAGFLTSNGELIDVDGTKGISVTNPASYFSIHHKSHLAVMSATPYTNGVYDFTTSTNQAMGNAQLKEMNGKYVLHCGDYDGNGNINAADFNNWASNSAALNQYLFIDGDGNGVINATDYNLWVKNKSKLGHPSLQY